MPLLIRTNSPHTCSIDTTIASLSCNPIHTRLHSALMNTKIFTGLALLASFALAVPVFSQQVPEQNLSTDMNFADADTAFKNYGWRAVNERCRVITFEENSNLFKVCRKYPNAIDCHQNISCSFEYENAMRKRLIVWTYSGDQGTTLIDKWTWSE